MSSRCAECGAATGVRSCQEVFYGLVSLDYQRVQPFASFHAVIVACYLLQHPSAGIPAHVAAQRTLVETFCDEGLDGLERLTYAARAQNSHRRRTTGAELFGPGTRDTTAASSAKSSSVTIHGVAADATFPAEGLADRMSAWARAVRESWSETTPTA